MKRCGLSALMVLMIMPFTSGCERTPQRQPIGEKANIIVIVIDTLRRDRVSAYGYSRQTTPVIDRLAIEGALADGVSTTSWTKPGTASILTGLHPLRHQAFSRGDMIPGEVVPLAQVLKSDGYGTFGFSSNTWVSKAWGFDRGFDCFFTMKALGHGHHASADQVNDEVIQRLDTLTSPYFLYVHYNDPHTPYDPPMGWDGSELTGELREIAPITDDMLHPHSFSKREAGLVRMASDLYDGEVRHTDQRVGELLDELRHRGLLDRSIVVLTSDHGEEFEDHGRMGHGHTVYRETTDVPLVIWGPGYVKAGVRLGSMSVMDIVPSILELANIERERWPQYDLDGRSRTAALTGGEDLDSGGPLLLHLDFDSGHGLAYLDKNYKLVLGNSPYVKSLYDLDVDPLEQRDLITENDWSQGSEALRMALAETYNRYTHNAFRRITTTIDAELASQLQALGYADQSGPRGDARLIPHQIFPADEDPSGLLGWETIDDMSSCLDLSSPDSLHQLLRGWYPGNNPRGRWSEPAANLVLRRPVSNEQSYEIVISAINFRKEAFETQISLGGAPISRETVLTRGEYEIVVPMPPLQTVEPLMKIGISTDPPFLPSLEGSEDARTLGIFVSAVCVRPTTVTP